MEDSVALAFLVTLIAGLCTGLGSLVAFFYRRPDHRLLSVSLGFSAGVMVYISFVSILPTAADLLSGENGRSGPALAALGFFGGIGIMALVERLLPTVLHHPEQEVAGLTHGSVGVGRADPQSAPSDASGVQLPGRPQAIGLTDPLVRARIMRTGLLMAVAIGLHNLPEGFATFLATLSEPTLGIALAVAVAIHNVPEGIAVSVPIYYATGSRLRALAYSFASGVAEPVGALIGFLLLRPYVTDTSLGIVFAALAGIMVYISFDEVLPAARDYGKHTLSMVGLFAGMAVMAGSLLLLA